MGAKNLEIVQIFFVGLCFFFVATYGSEVIFTGAKNPKMVQNFSVGLCFFFVATSTEMRSFLWEQKTWNWSRIFL